MDDIKFKSNWRERESITLWLTPKDKALYKLLRDEYSVNVSLEMKKAVTRHLEALKCAVITKESA